MGTTVLDWIRTISVWSFIVEPEVNWCRALHHNRLKIFGFSSIGRLWAMVWSTHPIERRLKKPPLQSPMLLGSRPKKRAEPLCGLVVDDRVGLE